jgi:hypothetical protein
VGAVAVFVTLVYLAAQIRHATRIATASSEIEIRSGYGELNQAIYGDVELAELFIKAQSSDEQLNAAEQMRLMAWVTQMMNQWVAIEIAYNNGMVPAATYEVIFDDHRRFIGDSPALRPLVRKLLDYYPAMSETASNRSLEQLLKEYGA